MDVRREVEVEASPEEVWEALVSEEGRERWLEPDPERELRVEVLVVAAPAGWRVVVVESQPAFPLVALATAFSSAVA